MESLWGLHREPRLLSAHPGWELQPSVLTPANSSSEKWSRLEPSVVLSTSVIMKKLECIFLVKSTARISKQQPQIQPFEDGEASTASGYQSHKLFITKKRNPSYDSLSLPVQTPLKNSLLGVILEWDDLEIRIMSSYNSLKPYLHPGQFFILLNIVLGNSWAKDYCASKMMYAWG